jgi:hypothetical protein
MTPTECNRPGNCKFCLDDEMDIPLTRFHERLRAHCGELAAVLWDELNISIDPDFKSRHPSAPRLSRYGQGLDIVGFKYASDPVRVVQWRGRMLAAWIPAPYSDEGMGDWIVRQRPYDIAGYEANFESFKREVREVKAHADSVPHPKL